MGLFDFVGDLLGIGDAPAPDPAIGAAAQANAAIGSRYADLAEQTYADQKALFEEYSPILKQLLTTQAAEQGKSITRADEAWASYNDTWKPIEKEMAARTLELASPGRAEQEGQRAADEATAGYDRARTTTQRSLAAAGASPEKMAAIEASGRLMEAKGVAGAASGARRDTEARSLGYLDNASRFGRNMTSTGLAAAGLATNQGGATQSAYGGLVNATGAPAAGAAGLYSGAVDANNSAASNYMNLFSAESQVYGQKLDFMGDIIGAGAMTAGMLSSEDAKDMGGKVDGKKASLAVAKSPSKKWSYKPGLGDGNTKKRMGPTAQSLNAVAPDVSDGETVDVISMLGLHHAAVGDNTKRLAKIEKKLGLAGKGA